MCKPGVFGRLRCDLPSDPVAVPTPPLSSLVVRSKRSAGLYTAGSFISTHHGYIPTRSLVSIGRNRTLAWLNNNRMAGGQTQVMILATACPSPSCRSPAHFLAEDDPDLPPIRLLFKRTMPSGGVRRCVFAPTLLYNLTLFAVLLCILFLCSRSSNPANKLPPLLVPFSG